MWGVMDIDALSMLADAISDVGSWWCWQVEGDTVQVEFRDVQLYDESKPEREPHSTDVLAVRFRGHAFAVFLDNLDEVGWHERFRDDDSILYPIESYAPAFDNAEGAESLLDDYKNHVSINCVDPSETLSTAKHLLYARCGEVAFIVGGDKMVVIGNKGKYTTEEIKVSAEKWWAYWKTYWELRGTEAAYPTDYVCEITIPISND
jgi:hypothetical protein